MIDSGDAAPDFIGTAVIWGAVTGGCERVEVSLSSLLDSADKGLVIYFYPRAMTPGCTKQACDFRDSIEVLRQYGYAVVGVSPDSLERLEKFAQRDSLTFPLISDSEHEIMGSYGAWGEKKNYGRTVLGTIRSTFVINPDGTIVLAQRNVKATGHVARLKKELGIDG